MTMQLTEDQTALRTAAGDFLSARCGFERVRAVAEGDDGWDAALWREFAVELGFAGIGFSESDGGIGMGPIEQALVLEELGRVLAPIPWFESVVLAGGIAAAAGCDRLPEIARGQVIAAPAIRDRNGTPLPNGIGPIVEQTRSGPTLRGEAHYVPFGHVASLLLVAARSHGSNGWDGISLFALPADAPGISVSRVVSLDLTRPYATVVFDAVSVAAEHVLGEIGGVGAILRDAWTRAAGLLASEQLGGAARSLEQTVAYAMQREQFGRLIGSFQAYKHRLADMKLLVDSARSAADWAARAIAADEEVEAACAGARAYCTDAFLHCAADAIQLHGGIGFTWEHPAHFFFKRARASATLLDPPDIHREIIARRLIDGCEAA